MNIVKELTAPVEIGLACLTPLYCAGIPRNTTNAPVVVIPGWTASNNMTWFLRKTLTLMGYSVTPWEFGTNVGVCQSRIDSMVETGRQLSEEHGQKVRYVGWSLGGVYARAIANTDPDHVKQIVTLGSPYWMPLDATAPIATAFKLLADQDRHVDDLGIIRKTPSVPQTSIYSKRDGVVHWEYCVDEDTTNLHVNCSHLSMTHHPVVTRKILKALAKVK